MTLFLKTGHFLTCKHALDWLLCEALCKLELLDRHGVGPADITVDDWGPDIAGAIALNPAMLSEDKALHSLSKVLHPTQMLLVSKRNLHAHKQVA